MDAKMILFLTELAGLLEKHRAGLFYTTADDGVHVTIGDGFTSRCCIGWPNNGNCDTIRAIINQTRKKP